MIAKKCDRCFKYYDHYEKLIDKRTGGSTNAVIFISRDLINSTNFERRRHLDLCPHCMKQLIVFIFGDDEEETKHVD